MSSLKSYIVHLWDTLRRCLAHKKLEGTQSAALARQLSAFTFGWLWQDLYLYLYLDNLTIVAHHAESEKGNAGYSDSLLKVTAVLELVSPREARRPWELLNYPFWINLTPPRQESSDYLAFRPKRLWLIESLLLHALRRKLNVLREVQSDTWILSFSCQNMTQRFVIPWRKKTKTFCNSGSSHSDNHLILSIFVCTLFHLASWVVQCIRGENSGQSLLVD